MRKSSFCLIKTYYYTLEDILRILKIDKLVIYEISTIKDLIDNHFENYISKKGYYYDGLHSNNLWQLVYAKFRNQFIGFSANDEKTISKKELFEMLFPIFEKIQESYPKYDLLLTKYSETKDFFAPITSKTTSKGDSIFNDTPQIAEGFQDDKYASNYTKNNTELINESDVNSIMARILEVDSNYRNLLKEWCDSFFELFIEEMNISGVNYEVEL